MELVSDRLILRQWKETDIHIFIECDSDPEVMRYFPDLPSEEEIKNFVVKAKRQISENGWGFWAVELKETAEFIGFVGLNSPQLELPFTPCVEIGWRLHKKYWGNGYATEAASKSLDYAFQNLQLDEVVAFTAIANLPSQAVMQRLGMLNTGKNFFHPSVPEGHVLTEHVLYSINKNKWKALP